ncbi:FkbM family methyltransferase [Ginsengibacter hankyongi]|uniref:FkbM family methyltransferase n=1 Tax=Ginsengibacter hankyongi TaxID=2607284 RepID=A0A5J5IF36_9BACT|nr:FkbM family methyltransferase [Ginsengibacter hankyongi]KAA9034601.1 FkbM family methyltransferase [Ginsengibacter hankyongi]
MYHVLSHSLEPRAAELMNFSQKIRLRYRSFKIHLEELGGFWKTSKYFFEKHILRKKQLRLTVKGNDVPIYLRNFTSDIDIFAQIFINKEYENGIKTLPVPKIILDCGANIGLAALYFNYRYPYTLIYCFEPEHSNYKLLRQNVGAYSNIKTYEHAIWTDTEKLYLNLNNPNDSFTVSDKNNDDVVRINAVSLNDFLLENQIDKIDLLKLDIEGAELPLFSKNLDWIHKVDVIIVEIHERINPGSTQYINDLLTPYFAISYTGEYVKYTRKTLN